MEIPSPSSSQPDGVSTHPFYLPWLQAHQFLKPRDMKKLAKHQADYDYFTGKLDKLQAKAAKDKAK